MPQIGEIWRHYKGGVYEITGFAYGAEGEELRVRVLYCSDGVVFSRPIDNFLDQVKGYGPRFRCVN